MLTQVKPNHNELEYFGIALVQLQHLGGHLTVKEHETKHRREYCAGPSFSAQAFYTVHFKFTTQNFLGFGDVGPALHRVIFGQGIESRLELNACEAGNYLLELPDGDFIGAADVIS